MQRYYNNYYFNINFYFNNAVILNYININIKRQNYKLNYKKLELYYIKYKFSTIIYKLNFLKNIRISSISYIKTLE